MNWSLLSLIHLVGLALAVGAATVKLILLFKSRFNYSFIPVYVKVFKPITKILLTGFILLTVSGIGWLLDGYPLYNVLIIKLAFVAAIWILGPIIDKIIEPKFLSLIPATDQPVSPEFIKAQKNYLIIEITAVVFFYFIIALWVLS
jgi:hypothetical protein